MTELVDTVDEVAWLLDQLVCEVAVVEARADFGGSLRQWVRLADAEADKAYDSHDGVLGDALNFDARGVGEFRGGAVIAISVRGSWRATSMVWW